MEKNKSCLVKLSTVGLEEHFFEKYADKQRIMLCGIDEAGRGSLAGPLVAAAVHVPPGAYHALYMQDSKKLSPQRRRDAYAWIMRTCQVGVGMASQGYIDRRGVQKANGFAMEKALSQLIYSCKTAPILIALVDAYPLSPNWWQFYVESYNNDIGIQIKREIENRAEIGKIISFPHGETYSYAIAAASVVAKVVRDNIVERAAQYTLGYGLEQHKGYGTKKHYHALQVQGHSLMHRTSFLRSFLEQE